ncbi:adenosylcobinamide-GDP ribazoletransferase [Brevibacillus ginsengisoli]|uniref:adenosylcobinamide-GDP ribazoletransferase n=1 Tax=Brevibacillus ginsengisoli TaxID=363854 RepID=UPI003CEDF951
MRSLIEAFRNVIQALVVAINFMTTIPIPGNFPFTQTACRRSVVFYPLAGALIGLILMLAGMGLSEVFPLPLCGVLLMVIWLLLTGGLHLDGLMDTADGILSHRSREEMLAIMKDSRVGAMGVIVCVAHLLLKTTLIGTWLQFPDMKEALILFSVPIWSRWFVVLSIAGWPYARKQGLGSYVRAAGYKHVLLATFVALLVSMLGFYLTGFFPIGQVLILPFAMLGIAGIFGWLINSYFHRNLGGLTGDTYGAVNELLEVVLLLMSYLVIKLM